MPRNSNVSTTGAVDRMWSEGWRSIKSIISSTVLRALRLWALSCTNVTSATTSLYADSSLCWITPMVFVSSPNLSVTNWPQNLILHTNRPETWVSSLT